MAGRHVNAGLQHAQQGEGANRATRRLCSVRASAQQTKALMPPSAAPACWPHAGAPTLNIPAAGGQ